MNCGGPVILILTLSYLTNDFRQIVYSLVQVYCPCPNKREREGGREWGDGGGIAVEGEVSGERRKMERDMGGDEEVGLYSRAYGGCHSIILLAFGRLIDDGRPFRRTRSFQHRHSHFFRWCHWLQSPCMHSPLTLPCSFNFFLFCLNLVSD